MYKPIIRLLFGFNEGIGENILGMPRMLQRRRN